MKIVLVDMVAEYLALFEWWPNMPQWEWAEKSGAEICPWPHSSLYVDPGKGLPGLHTQPFFPPEKDLSQRSFHICDVINDHVDDKQKNHINNLKTSKAQLDVMKTVSGVSGKGRLPAMLVQFVSYTKSADQTIDQVVSDLRKLRNDIADVYAPSAPSDILMATTLMSACKESEYDIAKVILGMSDHLTTELAVEKLKVVEAAKDSAIFAGRGGRKARDRGGQPQERDLRQVKCYMCDEKGHIMRNCPMRGLARKRGDAHQSSHE